MVQDAIWLKALPNYSELKTKAIRAFNQGERANPWVLLCFKCLRKKLGRPLRISDFKLRAPINELLLMGIGLERHRWTGSSAVFVPDLEKGC
jgi:hypothetical protein